MQVQSYNIWKGSLTADDGRTRRMTASDGKNTKYFKANTNHTNRTNNESGCFLHKIVI